MKQKLCDERKCTGCAACVSICPKKAISMIEDEKGFLRPKINVNKCVNCGRCTKFVKTLSVEKKCINETFASRLKNKKKLIESQSGGLFTALAEYIIETNGIVYGCTIDDEKCVKHIRVAELNNLKKLKGSKYVQSNIIECFTQIKEDLKNDKIVLFSGTPCQVSAIYNYLNFNKLDLSKFYSCDLICHGVASPILLKKYIDYLEKKHSSKISSFCFREKNSGWRNIKSLIRFENGDTTNDYVYADLYYSNLGLRESCEDCPNIKKKFSDLTIGDCWGFHDKYPMVWNDNKGVSMAIIHTEKGREIFKKAQDKMDVLKIEEKDFLQDNLVRSSKVPSGKKEFWKDLERKSYKKFLRKYTSEGKLLFKIRRKIMKKIGRW